MEARVSSERRRSRIEFHALTNTKIAMHIIAITSTALLVLESDVFPLSQLLKCILSDRPPLYSLPYPTHSPPPLPSLFFLPPPPIEHNDQ